MPAGAFDNSVILKFVFDAEQNESDLQDCMDKLGRNLYLC